MKRKSPIPLLLIFAALLLLMSIPRPSVDRLRGATAAVVAPFWEYIALAKIAISPTSKPSESAEQPSPAKNVSEEIQRLTLENHLLRSELGRLQELIQHENHLKSALANLKDAPSTRQQLGQAVARHQKDLKTLLSLQLEAIPARVIFRSPSAWNSSVWINVGSSQNEAIGHQVIAKNSPVLAGSSLVGVIDYVGKNQSRVRLITDSGLYPSVRASRGTPQDVYLEQHVQKLMDIIKTRKDILGDNDERKNLYALLKKIRSTGAKERESVYLAKGELHGSSLPLWRTQGNVLKGIGFNYDFDDEDGPSRDLRNGKPYDQSSPAATLAILKPRDILITTGMDGVFPAGIQVAEVTKISLLKEGDYYYELEAIPTAGNLDELSLVFVIPPMGYDQADQPPPIGREKM